MWAVPTKVIFCGALMLIAPGIFSVCFCSPFLRSLRAPITSGIVFVLIPHILVVSISKSLYLESFSMVFNEVFLSDGTAISTSWLVLFFWSLITIRLTICYFSVLFWGGEGALLLL